MEDHGWHPSPDEVAHILDELRPIICRLADEESAHLDEMAHH
jgi:hypothetical protein